MCRKCIEEMDIPAEEKEKLIAEMNETSEHINKLIGEAIRTLKPVVETFSDQDYGAQAITHALAMVCGRLISYAPSDLQPKILMNVVEDICKAISIDGVKITPLMAASFDFAENTQGPKIKPPVLH